MNTNIEASVAKLNGTQGCLDEIDGGHRVRTRFIPRLASTKVSTDTIVQLFRFKASAVMGSSQPIYRMCSTG